MHLFSCYAQESCQCEMRITDMLLLSTDNIPLKRHTREMTWKADSHCGFPCLFFIEHRIRRTFFPRNRSQTTRYRERDSSFASSSCKKTVRGLLSFKTTIESRVIWRERERERRSFSWRQNHTENGDEEGSQECSQDQCPLLCFPVQWTCHWSCHSKKRLKYLFFRHWHDTAHVFYSRYFRSFIPSDGLEYNGNLINQAEGDRIPFRCRYKEYPKRSMIMERRILQEDTKKRLTREEESDFFFSKINSFTTSHLPLGLLLHPWPQSSFSWLSYPRQTGGGLWCWHERTLVTWQASRMHLLYARMKVRDAWHCFVQK